MQVPPTKRIIADSPKARHAARLTPVIIPERAAGKTIEVMVLDSVRPNERDASFNSLGTVEIAFSVTRVMSGRFNRRGSPQLQVWLNQCEKHRQIKHTQTDQRQLKEQKQDFLHLF